MYIHIHIGIYIYIHTHTHTYILSILNEIICSAMDTVLGKNLII